MLINFAQKPLRNLLKNVQSHTRHEIKSRHKARRAISGISMIPGLASVFQQVIDPALKACYAAA
jgi:hypothetical protein